MSEVGHLLLRYRVYFYLYRWTDPGFAVGIYSWVELYRHATTQGESPLGFMGMLHEKQFKFSWKMVQDTERKQITVILVT